ncbi:MAG: GDSL-type esterase/lipase family protein [Acidobacteriota bacterium]|nr:GDSL-type esterase/lipase family protein [Acidobacteriota bacterium]
MARLAVNPKVRRLLLLSLPAVVVSAIVFAILIEAWVRWSWDDKKGTPGFFVSDPVRGLRLGENYQGWFAGVPVRTNSLGFRATREYDLRKGPNTFRILMLGDSVTFGHGAVHDYPSLLEGMLEQWQPETDWQVWNLAVPGYNTSQELAQLRELGPAYQPDLVIVGFYINDIIGNEPPATPGMGRRAASGAMAFLQRHWYSVEFYKRVVLTAAWRLSGSEASRLRFENLESEERMQASTERLAESARQQITPFTRFTDAEVAARPCPDGMKPSAEDLAEIQARPDWPSFVEAVREFQELNRQGAYKVMFFLNLIPPVCPDGDFFYDGKAIEHDYFLQLFSVGTPAVSAYPAFMRVKPSEMPLAEAHAIGNANQLKAEVLFEHLKQTLPQD